VRLTERGQLHVSNQPEQTDTKVLLSVSEAATALSLSRSLLYELLMRGEVPSIKIGRSRRVPVKALHDFVARQLSDTQGGNVR
jgi:excisionase family DNA binding protein